MPQRRAEPNLFDVDPPALQRKKQPAAPPGTVSRLIGIYRAGYERRFHELPVVLNRDGALLKRLVLQYGVEKVEQRLRAFLQWDADFVVDSGYALSLFYSCWNRLAARVLQPAGREPSVERTAAYLQSLKAHR